jgi:hypothetical protein
VRIDDRDVVFRVDDKYYRIHLAQTVHEAMRKPIPESEAKPSE